MTATTNAHVGIFGYGSLVNWRTRPPNEPANSFVIQGWQRYWGHCVSIEAGNVCALTIRPKVGQSVAGALVRTERQLLPALDDRERGYQRVHLVSENERPPVPGTVGSVDIFTYTSEPPMFRLGDAEYPIWCSYLECVLAGFVYVGGESAAQQFIETTEGWEAPILDDRATPKYPRYYALDGETKVIVHSLLKKNRLIFS